MLDCSAAPCAVSRARLDSTESNPHRNTFWDMPMTARTAPRWPVRYLLFIGGLGGLLYGIDIGIIAGALPYLEATASHAWQLSSQQLGFVVAAVLLGSVLSSLFAGMVADLIGRRGAMLLAGLLFTASIPIMALASGYTPLLLGRLLQGISGGLIGVVIPLYLAEVLSPERRGRGAAMFQLLLTIGLVLAALIGLYQARPRRGCRRRSRAFAAGRAAGAGTVHCEGPRLAHHLLDLPGAGPAVLRRHLLAVRITTLAGAPRSHR